DLLDLVAFEGAIVNAHVVQNAREGPVVTRGRATLAIANADFVRVVGERTGQQGRTRELAVDIKLHSADGAVVYRGQMLPAVIGVDGADEVDGAVPGAVGVG